MFQTPAAVLVFIENKGSTEHHLHFDLMQQQMYFWSDSEPSIQGQNPECVFVSALWHTRWHSVSAVNVCFGTVTFHHYGILQYVSVLLQEEIETMPQKWHFIVIITTLYCGIM